jgi:hypothetical protein
MSGEIIFSKDCMSAWSVSGKDLENGLYLDKLYRVLVLGESFCSTTVDYALNV